MRPDRHTLHEAAKGGGRQETALGGEREGRCAWSEEEKGETEGELKLLQAQRTHPLHSVATLAAASAQLHIAGCLQLQV